MKNFSGTAAIVAGAGGGMGLCIANDLIRAGVCVSMADIKPEPTDIATGAGRHHYRQGDLSDEKFVEELVTATVRDMGGVSYLVNTTGVLWFDRDQSLVTMDMDVWDRVFEINLKSHVLTTRHVVPLMREHGGAIVHFSSIDALRGDPQPQDAYAISKAALIRLSRSIAVQYAGDGIRSNVVLPGPTLSPMQTRWQGQSEQQAELTRRIPLRRLGAVQDMANACLFLLSDEASYITGTELIVDGGISA